MPIFEYKCSDCGSVFEKLVRGSDPVTCPACNSANVAKMISAAVLHGCVTSHDTACASCQGGMCSSCEHNT